MRKKVIYQCYGGAHSSVVAAAIHTGTLQREDTPAADVFLKLPYFDKTKKEDIGALNLFGTVHGQVDIYTMGMGGGKRVLQWALYSFFADQGISPRDFLLVNTLSQVNLLTRLGGGLSRGLGLVSLGRPLVLLGIQAAYPRFVDLVTEVEEKIQSWYLDEGKEI